MTGFSSNRRQSLAHLGILVTFALIPFWYRFPQSPPAFSLFYSLGFIIFWPMLWTVVWWLVAGLPGWNSLWQNRAGRWWVLSLSALAFWALLSWAWSYTRVSNPAVTVSSAIPFVFAVVFALATACLKPSISRVTTILIIGLAWNSVLTGLQVAQQGSVGLQFFGEFNLNPLRSGVVVVQAGGIRWLRPYGLLPHPNILAGFLVISLSVHTAWLTSQPRRLQLILGTIIFVLGLWSLLLTFSRAAWMSYAAGLCVLFVSIWLCGRRCFAQRIRFIGILGLCAVLGGLFLLQYQPFLAARTGLSEESIELRSISDRAVYNQIAFEAIQDSPLLGVGIGNFPWYAAGYLRKTDFDLRGQPVHNIFLSACSELGLVGLVLLLVNLSAGLWAAFRLMSSASTHILRVGFASAVVALMIIGLLDHYPWTLIQFQVAWWAMFGIAVNPGLPSSEDALVEN